MIFLYFMSQIEEKIKKNCFILYYFVCFLNSFVLDLLKNGSYKMLYIFFFPIMMKINKKKNNRLSYLLPIYFEGIQLRRSNSNLEGVNINSTKFDQPISTFVPFSQSIYEQRISSNE
jgi:hypothetical protein